MQIKGKLAQFFPFLLDHCMKKGTFSSTEMFTHLQNFYAAILNLSPYFCDMHLFRSSTPRLRKKLML